MAQWQRTFALDPRDQEPVSHRTRTRYAAQPSAATASDTNTRLDMLTSIVDSLAQQQTLLTRMAMAVASPASTVNTAAPSRTSSSPLVRAIELPKLGAPDSTDMSQFHDWEKRWNDIDYKDYEDYKDLCSLLLLLQFYSFPSITFLVCWSWRDTTAVFQGSWPGQTSMIFNCHTPALKHSFTPNVSTQLLGASTVEVKCRIVEEVFYERCKLCRLLLFHSTEEVPNKGGRAHFVMASKIPRKPCWLANDWAE